MLPKDWGGRCTLKAVRPLFFLLPCIASQQLGMPLYEELQWKKREIQIGGTQRRGDDEWPPERIIATWGPAMWAQDGMWGYQTPIYMLNRIIRLQALVEIITNQTSLALDLLSTQSHQMHTMIHLNRLAIDYLLAEEEGVLLNSINQNVALKLTIIVKQLGILLITSENWFTCPSKSGHQS